MDKFPAHSHKQMVRIGNFIFASPTVMVKKTLFFTNEYLLSCNTCKIYSSQMGMTTVHLATFSVAEIITVAELGRIGTGLNFLFFKSKTCRTHSQRHYHQNTTLGQD